MPKFNGVLTEWGRSTDLFVCLVHNRADLTPFVKHYHSVTSLVEGEALVKRKHLDILSDNYAIAWNTLTEFYKNKTVVN